MRVNVSTTLLSLGILASSASGFADASTVSADSNAREEEGTLLIASVDSPPAAQGTELAPPSRLDAAEETWTQLTQADDHSADIQWLEQKARRQFGLAMGLYGWGVAFSTWGFVAALDNCEDDGSLSFCEPFRPVVSSLLFSTALVPALGAGLPLHMASKRNRAAAAALETGQHPSFSRDLHRGPYLLRAGKRTLYSVAGLGAVAIASGVVAAKSNPDMIVLSGYSTAGAVFAAALGTGLYVRGNRLMERGLQARPVQAVVAPSFYGDGAGLSLWMGF